VGKMALHLQVLRIPIGPHPLVALGDVLRQQRRFVDRLLDCGGGLGFVGDGHR